MHATYLRLDILVWDSNRTVIRAARRKLARSALRDPAKRDARKRFYREMLRHHADAQRLMAQFRL
ncbi:hypothetical protein [Paracoccus siganidrum]|uniref:Uncharacterized protein n=1 Tax=Paracoccus siganidrum TaxID=1276757 RepID=A0A419A6R8_9RHOB|nr:hypothetical protein [Paracoccus siganidrum]RJL15809.1 hypothetical protein D3P05_10500 [Paracoccus siganidrum]RMC29378.1 hypothetical protein C9E82_20500 [Paracoccus siganidrum]